MQRLKDNGNWTGGPAEASKMSGQAWNSMSEADKEKYVQMAE